VSLWSFGASSIVNRSLGPGYRARGSNYDVDLPTLSTNQMLLRQIPKQSTGLFTQNGLAVDFNLIALFRSPVERTMKGK
jgi:hypothetical protein